MKSISRNFAALGVCSAAIMASPIGADPAFGRYYSHLDSISVPQPRQARPETPTTSAMQSRQVSKALATYLATESRPAARKELLLLLLALSSR